MLKKTLIKKTLFIAAIAAASWSGVGATANAQHCDHRGYSSYRPSLPGYGYYQPGYGYGHGAGYGSYRPPVGYPYGQPNYSSNYGYGYYGSGYGGGFNSGFGNSGYGNTWGSYGAGGFPRGGAYGMGGAGPGFSLYSGR